MCLRSGLSIPPRKRGRVADRAKPPLLSINIGHVQISPGALFQIINRRTWGTRFFGWKMWPRSWALARRRFIDRGRTFHGGNRAFAWKRARDPARSRPGRPLSAPSSVPELLGVGGIHLSGLRPPPGAGVGAFSRGGGGEEMGFECGVERRLGQFFG